MKEMHIFHLSVVGGLGLNETPTLFTHINTNLSNNWNSVTYREKQKKCVSYLQCRSKSHDGMLHIICWCISPNTHIQLSKCMIWEDNANCDIRTPPYFVEEDSAGKSTVQILDISDYSTKNLCVHREFQEPGEYVPILLVNSNA